MPLQELGLQNIERRVLVRSGQGNTNPCDLAARPIYQVCDQLAEEFYGSTALFNWHEYDLGIASMSAQWQAAQQATAAKANLKDAEIATAVSSPSAEEFGFLDAPNAASEQHAGPVRQKPWWRFEF